MTETVDGINNERVDFFVSWTYTGCRVASVTERLFFLSHKEGSIVQWYEF